MVGDGSQCQLEHQGKRELHTKEGEVKEKEREEEVKRERLRRKRRGERDYKHEGRGEREGFTGVR